jgi:hypothetical protein
MLYGSCLYPSVAGKTSADEVKWVNLQYIRWRLAAPRRALRHAAAVAVETDRATRYPGS